MEPCKMTVDAWLRADLEAPRKQRQTAKRIGTRAPTPTTVTVTTTAAGD
jgi:hypothetical protein